ncbi:hypothetical protein [Methylobacterium gnaphalii]|uniref:Uncharacterized protein n=1 Tax=Methylobacterium gnaphalii TaxID=1010610 RepID=A0A512JF60_9HYPH|nr:hypothetical protein [Methylobacterium gnaphalii]GEP08572.1 hypothetical protein MGN01_04170 [Methylobacterium gnaphalii]GJD70592.1 hypothetical protein MMMDOFMJ_3541 [Methylobacterium gnaphalii]GLS50789.1 hypothetical protein GCM10007885_36430 [Methylobacterium gnaphalii]
MIPADHAPAIARFLTESHAASVPGFDLRAALDEHWPAATAEEIERGLQIAAECVDGRLAEIRAENAEHAVARLAPATRAEMLDDVAAAVSGLGRLDELIAALEPIGARWPDLPWLVFMDGVRRGARAA